MKQNPKHKLSFKPTESGYPALWGRVHETLLNLAVMISDLKHLCEEFEEECDQTPSACTAEKENILFDMALLRGTISNLREFSAIYHQRLTESIESAVRDYGEQVPEWFALPNQ